MLQYLRFEKIIGFQDDHTHLVTAKLFSNAFDHNCIRVCIRKGIDNIRIDFYIFNLETQKSGNNYYYTDNDPTVFYDSFH